jgi:hypothetical protein
MFRAALALVAILAISSFDCQARAEERATVEAINALRAERFVSSENAGRLALILEYGSGAHKIAAQRAGKLSITKLDRCYLVPGSAIRDESVWLMLNNEAIDKDRGPTTLGITTSHYKLGETAEGVTLRKTSRVKRYKPIQFDLSPDISKSSSDQRVAFYAGTTGSDLIVLDVKSTNAAYRDVLDGRYYLMLNDRIAYENLIPGCRKLRILGFLSFFW